MRIALTIDDAPTIIEPGVPSTAELMDDIRVQLIDAGVAECVAFVVGERAIGHEDKLRKWLDAGYQLANHTQFHEAASRVSADKTLESVKLCDELLDSIGAFRNYDRWFRFPYLDRGGSNDVRRQLADGLKQMGYRLAHASVDFYDYKYERLWQQAPVPRLVEERFCSAALQAIKSADRRLHQRLGSDVPHIGYCHFSPLCSRTLPRLITLIRANGGCLIPMAEASEHPVYQRFDADWSKDGPVAGSVAPHPRYKKLVSKVVERFVPATTGPRWPHVE